MKKLIISLMTLMMVVALIPSNVTAGPENRKASVTFAKSVEPADANALIARLDVIKAMDVSNLTSIEKKALRKEVRSIEGTLKQMDGSVVYISAGGLLLVVLLLIILL